MKESVKHAVDSIGIPGSGTVPQHQEADRQFGRTDIRKVDTDTTVDTGTTLPDRQMPQSAQEIHDDSQLLAANKGDESAIASRTAGGTQMLNTEAFKESQTPKVEQRIAYGKQVFTSPQYVSEDEIMKNSG